MNYLKNIQAALVGVAVGDALGVPVEFNSRHAIKENPVTGMRGYGTYNLPPGTWSNDSSMTFCLAEVLTGELDIQTLGKYFVQWYRENFWTPLGEVFDIGIGTRKAIANIENGVPAEESGLPDEEANGNGALMRILPLLFYMWEKPVDERYRLTKLVCAPTHRHERSVISCFYYLEFARQILMGKSKTEIYTNLQREVPGFLQGIPEAQDEIRHFDRLLKVDISSLPEDQIQSSGYTVQTLEASIWCLLKTSSYPEAVLQAVNLGDDADTTGAVTGGLAGLLYRFDSIPEDWRTQIARYEDILDLAQRVADSLYK